MSADLGFVTHAAKRHAHEVTACSLGDGLAQRSLPDAGRTDEAEDWSTHLIGARLHGEVLQYALLHLLQPVVVRVQHVFSVLQVAHHFFLAAPGERYHPVEIVAHDGGLRGHRRHLAQLLHLGLGLGARFFRHRRLGDFLFQLADLVALAAACVAITQLALDRLHLLVEVVLALRLLHLPLHAVADLPLHLEHADLAFHQREHLLQALGDIDEFEQLFLVFELDRQLRRDRISQVTGVGDRAHSANSLGRDLAVEFHIAVELLDDGAHQRSRLFRLSLFLVETRELGGIVVTLVDQLLEPRAMLAFHQHFHGAVRKLQQLQDRGDHTHAVEVFFGRVVDASLLLRDEQDFAAAFLDFLKRSNGFVASHEEGSHHAREHDNIAQGQDGEDRSHDTFLLTSPQAPSWKLTSVRKAGPCKKTGPDIHLMHKVARQGSLFNPRM